MALSESILTRLQYQHKTIDELIDGLSEEQLETRVNPDKWSAFENIVHLAAYQPIFIQRINLMLTENEPLFERYVAENDPVFHEYQKKSLTELLETISSDRITILNVVKRLNEEQLKRTGKHKAYGSITLARWFDFFLLHEAHHLWTIFQLNS
ncbi:MAG TPA: DinB family protein, partial [Puia sp.]|nr:DinB family protein [Puia sp.]